MVTNQYTHGVSRADVTEFAGEDCDGVGAVTVMVFPGEQGWAEGMLPGVVLDDLVSHKIFVRPTVRSAGDTTILYGAEGGDGEFNILTVSIEDELNVAARDGSTRSVISLSSEFSIKVEVRVAGGFSTNIGITTHFFNG